MFRMKNFFTQSSNYLYLLVAILSFLLGTTSSIIVGFVTRSIEKRRLIDLFLADIRRHWPGIDSLKSAPVGPNFSRGVYQFKHMKVHLLGEPDYEFEVHNVRLYDSEGVKLALSLGSKSRKQFWDVYALLRDAEAVRQLIKSLPNDDKSRASYQDLFVKLVTKLARQFDELEQMLRRERAIFSRLLGL